MLTCADRHWAASLGRPGRMLAQPKEAISTLTASAPSSPSGVISCQGMRRRSESLPWFLLGKPSSGGMQPLTSSLTPARTVVLPSLTSAELSALWMVPTPMVAGRASSNLRPSGRSCLLMNSA